MLEERAEFQVSGQAADGLEALRKAEDLQPDLILLDICLPKLNGIEALPQIRKVAPKSKILFLTGFNSPELAEDLLSKVASGYVIKFEAGGNCSRP
jgi:DNA-binding NarL/FixJ family response regulator